MPPSPSPPSLLRFVATAQGMAAARKASATPQESRIIKEAEEQAEKDATLTAEELKQRYCEIATNPVRYNTDYAKAYLQRFSTLSQHTILAGTIASVVPSGAPIGVPMAAAGAVGALFAEGSLFFMRLYQKSSTEIKRRLRPLYTLICKFDISNPELIAPVFEILRGLEMDLAKETDINDQINLVETAKLNLVIQLAMIKMSGGRKSRGRKFKSRKNTRRRK